MKKSKLKDKALGHRTNSFNQHLLKLKDKAHIERGGHYEEK